MSITIMAEVETILYDFLLIEIVIQVTYENSE